MPITGQAPTGYYQFKTTEPDGRLIGRWSSILLNAGYEVHLAFNTNGSRSSYPIPHPSIRRFAIPGGGELKMVHLSGGAFVMGSREGERGRGVDEGPSTTVTLTEGLYVSRCEITQKQWRNVVGTAPWQSYRETAERFGLAVTVAEDGDFYPVESVGWDGVQLFIDALNSHAGADVY